MALTKNINESEKTQNKDQKYLERYNLKNINPEDIAQCAEILKTLTATNLMQESMALQMKKPEETLPVYYLKSIMEQNWIIIKQLDRISSLLEGK